MLIFLLNKNVHQWDQDIAMAAVSAFHLRTNVDPNLTSNNVREFSETLPVIKTDTLCFRLSHSATVVNCMFQKQKLKELESHRVSS